MTVPDVELTSGTHTFKFQALSAGFNLDSFAFVLTGTGVKSARGNSLTFKLAQNYPNPFNPSTMINYQLPINSHVTLKVYDVLGRDVATLVDRAMSAGDHEAVWNAGGLPSGVYVARLEANGNVKMQKMVLMK